MTQHVIPMLLISPDEEYVAEFEKALTPETFSFKSKANSLIGMNGTAAKLASQNEIILFEIDQTSDDVMAAVGEICEARKGTTKIFALAQKDLPLTNARKLFRAGVDEVLPRDALTDEIIPHIESIRMSREAQLPAVWAGHATQGKIIAIAKARGGVGASTLAVNLANELQAKKGYFKSVATTDVVVVDLDFQFGSIASLLDVPESDALWHMAMNGEIPDEEFVDQALVKSECGLSVLTAPSHYGPLHAIDAGQISSLLDVLKRKFDYIVVDLPNALIEWMTPITAQANCLYMVTDVTVPAVRSTRKLIDFYLGENPTLDIELVVNQEKKPLFKGAHHKTAEELLDREFRHWIPRDEATLRETIDCGQPTASVSSRSGVTRTIRKMALDLRKRLPPRAGGT